MKVYVAIILGITSLGLMAGAISLAIVATIHYQGSDRLFAGIVASAMASLSILEGWDSIKYFRNRKNL